MTRASSSAFALILRNFAALGRFARRETDFMTSMLSFIVVVVLVVVVVVVLAVVVGVVVSCYGCG